MISMNSPLQMISMLKNSKNSKEAIIKIVNNSGNPILKNLVEMAEKGDNKGVEDFARNLYKQKGMDFDKEFSQFMNNFK